MKRFRSLLLLLSLLCCAEENFAQNDSAKTFRPFASQIGVFFEGSRFATLHVYDYNTSNPAELYEFRNMRAVSCYSWEPYFLVPVDHSTGRHLLGAAVLYQHETWTGMLMLHVNQMNTPYNGLHFTPEGDYIRITPLYYYRLRSGPRYDWLLGAAIPIGVVSGIRVQQQFAIPLTKWLGLQCRTSLEYCTVTSQVSYGRVETLQAYQGLRFSAAAGLSFSYNERAERITRNSAEDSARKARTEIITWVGKGYGRFMGGYHLSGENRETNFTKISLFSYGPEWRRFMKRNPLLHATVRLTMNVTRYATEKMTTPQGNSYTSQTTFNVLQLAGGMGYSWSRSEHLDADIHLLAHEGFDLAVLRPFIGISAGAGFAFKMRSGAAFLLNPEFELSPFNQPFYSERYNNAEGRHDGRYRYVLFRAYAGISFPLGKKATE